MIQSQTYARVADNTGARKIICIRVLGRKRAGLGTTLVAVVKSSLHKAIVRRSEIVRAVVVRTRNRRYRDTQDYLLFDENAVVLINKEGDPLGSRIFGPVARELRSLQFIKIVSLSPIII